VPKLNFDGSLEWKSNDGLACVPARPGEPASFFSRWVDDGDFTAHKITQRLSRMDAHAFARVSQIFWKVYLSVGTDPYARVPVFAYTNEQSFGTRSDLRTQVDTLCVHQVVDQSLGTIPFQTNG
jgi:hypothetical protein